MKTGPSLPKDRQQRVGADRGGPPPDSPDHDDPLDQKLAEQMENEGGPPTPLLTPQSKPDKDQ